MAFGSRLIGATCSKIDVRWKMQGAKMVFTGRLPLSRLRRRFAPLRGTQRRCAALRAAPPGRYAPRALRAQAFCKHEKNAHLPMFVFAFSACSVFCSSVSNKDAQQGFAAALPCCSTSRQQPDA